MEDRLNNGVLSLPPPWPVAVTALKQVCKFVANSEHQLVRCVCGKHAALSSETLDHGVKVDHDDVATAEATILVVCPVVSFIHSFIDQLAQRWHRACDKLLHARKS